MKPTAVNPDILDIRSNNPFLSEAEQSVVRQKAEALDKLLSTEGLAKFKLELQFARNFSAQKPSVGALSFWESGSKLHGGGDAIMHICPDARCNSFIPETGHGYDFLVCPKCHTSWKGSEVIGQILARLTATAWTELLVKYFYRLGQNTDIVIKYHHSDFRSVALREQEKSSGGDLLTRARETRARRVYLLKDLITDMAAGSDISARIAAFVRA